MKGKNTIIVIVVIALIAIVIIGGLLWWIGSREQVGETIIPAGEQGEELEETYGLPLPKYPNMTKFMEEKDKETGSFSVMYIIEGADRAQEIANFYKEKLAAEGWTLDSEITFEQMLVFEFSKGENYNLTLTVSYADGITSFAIAYVAPSEEELKGPYESASEVEPSSDLNTAFHNDFEAVLISIFGGAKLTSASSDEYFEEFTYIVGREITKEDAQQVRVSLEEKGYETTSTKAEADVYRYAFSKQMLGKMYDDINVDVWLDKEGSRQQEVSITVYK